MAVPFWWFEDDVSTLLKTARKYDILVLVVGDAHIELYYVPAVAVFLVDVAPSPPPVSEIKRNKAVLRPPAIFCPLLILANEL